MTDYKTSCTNWGDSEPFTYRNKARNVACGIVFGVDMSRLIGSHESHLVSWHGRGRHILLVACLAVTAV